MKLGVKEVDMLPPVHWGQTIPDRALGVLVGDPFLVTRVLPFL